MTRVLVTAFEPFGGQHVNPSQQAVRRLALAPALQGVEVVTAELPVVFGASVDALRAAIVEHDPDVVVCAGEAGGRYRVTPERFAVNLDDAEIPDNAGRSPSGSPVVDGGPLAYASGLPVGEIVEALRAAGVPAAASSTAGHYVCNHTFYGLMHLVATERPGLVAGFVHVPYVHDQVLERADDVPSLSIESITRALEVVVATTVAALVREPQPTR